jgi:hypothetical protein
MRVVDWVIEDGGAEPERNVASWDPQHPRCPAHVLASPTIQDRAELLRPLHSSPAGTIADRFGALSRPPLGWARRS